MSTIHHTRIQSLNEDAVREKGRYVLYFMQASVRAAYNHALEYAVTRANELGSPPVVCFGLMDDYPEANARSYQFLLEGLADVAGALAKRGIRFVIRHGAPPDVALHYAKHASVVVCDRGYLTFQRRWRDAVADGAGCEVMQVETDVVVPVETVSDHDEFAARTIRPKLNKLRDKFLVKLSATTVKHSSLKLDIAGNIDVTDVPAALAKLKIDHSIKPVRRLHGGNAEAKKVLARFVRDHLGNYAEGRNEPGGAGMSMMSPYLHFGHISPVEIAITVREAKNIPAPDRDAYLEELIVRRELSMNHCFYNHHYDRYEGLTDWAKKTLASRAADERAYVYTREQLEHAETHDRWWNAAQREMTATGFMHNYMRMYWGKKILEWKRTPEEAFADLLHLNNKYFLDGRDPNSFANVAWIFGTHDRPWGPARPIFGTVRYMNDKGLERKFDMDAYAAFVERMEKAEEDFAE